METTDEYRRKSPEELLSEIEELKRGRLKIYLGAGTGTGKTYHMLRDGHELRASGVRVAVSAVDTDGRPETGEQMRSLEWIPDIPWQSDGRAHRDLDLERIAAGNPDVVLVDDLAHRNRPEAPSPTRLADIETLLGRGISVMTTLNVYDIEELREEVQDLTGIVPGHTVPLRVVAEAHEIKLVDVTPETVAVRMKAGLLETVPPSVDAKRYLKPENFAILREIALRLVAEEVNEELEEYLKTHGLIGPSAATEKVLVGIQYHSAGSLLIRRGQQMANRLGGELHVVAVVNPKQKLTVDQLAFKDAILELVRKIEAVFAEIPLENARSVADHLIEYSDREHITRIVVGQSRRTRWQELREGSIVNELLTKAKEVDLLITSERRNAEGQRMFPARRRMPRRSPYERLSPADMDRTIARLRQGHFKIYIGAAPGVGKTYTMLREARDLKARGIDVVAGLIETHGRRGTEAQISDLEVVPRRIITYRGVNLYEPDIESILRRNPDVVLIDELAHTNAPGSKNAKRFQDVIEILQAGISVITTVNVQHLESLNDAILRLTGVAVRETVPDNVLRMADEVILIDVTPDVLRQRMREGKIYAPQKVEQALANFFQPRNLIALRELALREVADNVDDRLEANDERSALRGPWRRIEVVYVCVNLKPKAERLIRRGFRTAHRLKAPMYVGFVQESRTLTPPEERQLEKIRALTERLGGTFEHLRANGARDIFRVLIAEMESKRVTQAVFGHSSRSRLEILRRGSLLKQFLRSARHLDVLVMTEAK